MMMMMMMMMIFGMVGIVMILLTFQMQTLYLISVYVFQMKVTKIEMTQKCTNSNSIKENKHVKPASIGT